MYAYFNKINFHHITENILLLYNKTLRKAHSLLKGLKKEKLTRSKELKAWHIKLQTAIAEEGCREKYLNTGIDESKSVDLIFTPIWFFFLA